MLSSVPSVEVFRCSECQNKGWHGQYWVSTVKFHLIFEDKVCFEIGVRIEKFEKKEKYAIGLKSLKKKNMQLVLKVVLHFCFGYGGYYN